MIARASDIVGIKLRVRQWEDMKREFGTSSNSTVGEYIPVPGHFVSGMRKFCGYLATVASTNESRFTIDLDRGKYVWTHEMFESPF